MLKQFKTAIITGVITLIVTLLCTWIINYGNKIEQNRTIEKYTDSIYTFKKKLNDSTELLVTERRTYHQTLEVAKQQNKVLRSKIADDIRKKDIITTSSTIASYDGSKVLKMYMDSTGIYRTAYSDLYETFTASFNTDTQTLDISTDSVIVPISTVKYLAKNNYKQYTGIKRVWKKIFEDKKMFVRIWSDNPKVRITSNEETTITK